LGIREEEILTMILCTLFLQKCTQANLVLADIAKWMQRCDDPDTPCLLENLIEKSLQLSAPNVSNQKTHEHHRIQSIDFWNWESSEFKLFLGTFLSLLDRQLNPS